MSERKLEVSINPVQNSELQQLAQLATRTWTAIYGPYMSRPKLNQLEKAGDDAIRFHNGPPALFIVARASTVLYLNQKPKCLCSLYN